MTIDIDVFFQGSHLAIPAAAKIASQPTLSETQLVNSSQLHQSRLGLLSQALMMIIATGFLFSETLEEFWKTKYVGLAIFLKWEKIYQMCITFVSESILLAAIPMISFSEPLRLESLYGFLASSGTVSDLNNSGV